MKPQLVNDAVIADLTYPKLFMPKIDGVRALNTTGTLIGRSLKTFKGFNVTARWSRPQFEGLDGEMISGDNPACLDRLCSRTTSDIGSFIGVTEMPYMTWWLFDLLTPEALKLPYEARYEALHRRWEDLHKDHPEVRIVPAYRVNNREELEARLAATFDAGYEGGIVRNPYSLPKEGRPDKNQQILRFKPWLDSEVLVTGITEGSTNENEATTNELGRTERSSHRANMVPNGRVGSLQGVLLADVFDPFTKRLLFRKDLPVTIAKGEMTAEEAKFYWENPREIVGKVAKWAHMTHGVKDLPRFPIFKSLRMLEDM